MTESKRLPISNTSKAVEFLLKGAAKRRFLATQKAKAVQREIGVISRLVAVK